MQQQQQPPLPGPALQAAARAPVQQEWPPHQQAREQLQALLAATLPLNVLEQQVQQQEQQALLRRLEQ